MINLQAGSLLHPIITATDAGQLRWEEDPVAGFMVTLGSNTISLYEVDRAASQVSHTESYVLRVLNDDNKVVDFIEYDETDTAFHDVRSLYASIRRQVFKADSVLTDLMDRLTTAR